MIAIDAPAPTLELVVSPLAIVVTEAVCVASASSAPVIIRFAAGPAPGCPTVAFVVTFEIEIATEGVIASLPSAPFSASVSIVSVVVAVSVRLPAPVSAAPSPTVALVVSLTMLMANDAPIPTPLTPPSSFRLCSVPVATDGSSASASPPLVAASWRVIPCMPSTVVGVTLLAKYWPPSTRPPIDVSPPLL